VKRDRLGRLLVFMARILQDDWASQVRATAVDENAAVLLELDGSATIVGGPAYFMDSTTKPDKCRRKTVLDFRKISVHHAAAGSSFDLKNWKGNSGEDYTLSVTDGKVQSIGSPHPIY
jgi:cyanophycinase